MKKKDYFLRSIHAKAHRRREWLLRCFTIVLDDPKDEPWQLRHNEDNQTVEVYVPQLDENNYDWEPLEDAEFMEVPYVYHEAAGPLKVGDLENVDRAIPDSCWGEILINARVIAHACGDRIPYISGEFSPSDLEKIFIDKMQDNPKPNEPEDPKALYVKHWLVLGKAVGDLDGCEFFIPSLTEHSLQPYPDAAKDRARLLSSYTDEELTDPVIQARIQDELVNKQKEYMKGDPAEGFILKGKTYNTALKQMFLIHGPEAGFSFGGRATLVPTCLDEGINTDYFPEMMNSQRAGSYFRGAMTALAGTDVDLVAREFQTSRVTDKFCGTTKTVQNYEIRENLIGRYIQIKGQPVELTKDTLPKYVGTMQSLYDPTFCLAEENDICPICIGRRLAEYPTSLGSAASEKQSTLMYVMMDAAHAKDLKTVKLKDNFLE